MNSLFHTTVFVLVFVALTKGIPLSETSLEKNEETEKNEIALPKSSESSSSLEEEDSVPALSAKVAKVFTTLNLTSDGKKRTDSDSNAADSTHPGYPSSEYGPLDGPFHHGPPPPLGYDYGINQLLGGHGLKIAGGSKENIFSQLVRLLLAIPTFKLSLLQPLILGFSNTVAHASHGAADVAGNLAHHIPAVAQVKGDVLRNLIGSFGQVTGSVLYVLAQLISSASSAKINFASHTLPHIFNSVTHATEGVASTVGSFAQGIADTIQMIVNGVIEAAKSKGNVVTRIVEGGHELKSGVIKGVLKIDDRPQHPPPPHHPPKGNYGPPGFHHHGR